MTPAIPTPIMSSTYISVRLLSRWQSSILVACVTTRRTSNTGDKFRALSSAEEPYADVCWWYNLRRYGGGHRRRHWQVHEDMHTAIRPRYRRHGLNGARVAGWGDWIGYVLDVTLGFSPSRGNITYSQHHMRFSNGGPFYFYSVTVFFYCSSLLDIQPRTRSGGKVAPDK